MEECISSRCVIVANTYEKVESYGMEALIIEPTDNEEGAEEVVNAEAENVQNIPTLQFDYKQSKYWGRYTALRSAGWATLGAGVGFFIGGYAMVLGSWGTNEDSAVGLAYAGTILVFSAPLLVVTSIPLLSCAYWNRHKAKKMYLDVGASVIPSMNTSPFRISTPAFGLALNF